MNDALKLILDVSIAVFIAGALFTAGLEVTLAQVLLPLRNRSLVVRAVLANLLLTPLLVYAILFVLPLEPPYAIGILLYGLASGAPYTPRLVGVAGGDMPKSIGLTILLTVLTIVTMPLALPLLVPNADISLWATAKPLLLQLFVPLALGLALRTGNARWAAWLHKPANLIVNLSAAAFLVLALVLHHEALLATAAAGTVTAALSLTLASFGLGYGLGTDGRRGRVTLALVTTARNIGAAVTIATTSFHDEPRVLLTIAVCMLVVFAVAFPAARFVFRGRLSEAPVRSS